MTSIICLKGDNVSIDVTSNFGTHDNLKRIPSVLVAAVIDPMGKGSCYHVVIKTHLATEVNKKVYI
jgi:hypothetical protein